MFDYPAIYKEADNLSNKTQRNYLWILRTFLCMLVVSSLLFTYFDKIFVIRLINAIISVIIVAVSVVFYVCNFQGTWYNARAVAESIKTISWRYAVKAEPYDTSDDVATKLFSETIKRIVEMNHDFNNHIEAEFSKQDSIPNSMLQTRQLSFEERLNLYHKERVIEQRDWYANKSTYNKKQNSLFFIILFVFSIVLLGLLFYSIKESENTLAFPVGVLLSLISVFFTWVQTKKYGELKNSYALASHEINFIATQKNRIKDEKEFSEYVINSENAFSREHTQWIARKDA